MYLIHEDNKKFFNCSKFEKEYYFWDGISEITYVFAKNEIDIKFATTGKRANIIIYDKKLSDFINKERDKDDYYYGRNYFLEYIAIPLSNHYDLGIVMEVDFSKEKYSGIPETKSVRFEKY